MYYANILIKYYNILTNLSTYRITMNKEIEKLKEIREKLKLSQVTVAKELGVTKQYYNKVEKGLTALSKEKAVQLCNAYGISFDWFFGDEGHMLLADQNIQEKIFSPMDTANDFSLLLDVYNTYLTAISKVVKTKYTNIDIEDEIAVAKFLFMQDCFNEAISYTTIKGIKEKFINAIEKNGDIKIRILATFFYLYTENPKHKGKLPDLVQ